MIYDWQYVNRSFKSCITFRCSIIDIIYDLHIMTISLVIKWAWYNKYYARYRQLKFGKVNDFVFRIVESLITLYKYVFAHIYLLNLKSLFVSKLHKNKSRLFCKSYTVISNNISNKYSTSNMGMQHNNINL